MKIFCDIETRSRTDLARSGTYRYVEDDDFEILMCAWAVDDGPVQVAVGYDEIRQTITLRNPRGNGGSFRCRSP